MLALVKDLPQPGATLMEWPEPTVRTADDVLIEVAACGVCGSDLQYLRWEPHIRSELQLPVVLGHEVAGTVVGVGSSVTQVRVGDRVVTESWARCGRCHECQTGRMNHCQQLHRIGHTIDGGFAPLIVTPSVSVYRIPDELPFGEAATLKPTGVALHLFERVRLVPGDAVVVIGPGTIGLLAAMIAVASGASTVMVVGLARDARRLALAAAVGCEPLVLGEDSADNDEIVDAVRRRTAGRGADIVLDTSGGQGTLSLAVELACRGGQIGLVGLGRPAPFDAGRIVLKELSVLGSLTRVPSTWDRAIRLVAARRVDLRPLITHEIPLADALGAFDLLERGDAIKAIIVP